MVQRETILAAPTLPVAEHKLVIYLDGFSTHILCEGDENNLCWWSGDDDELTFYGECVIADWHSNESVVKDELVLPLELDYWDGDGLSMKVKGDESGSA